MGPEEEARRYRSYRRRQAVRLLDILPREAVRPLYRRAAEEAVRRRVEPSAVAPSDADPLELLLGFCERLLPLPPLEIWRADLGRHPDGHLADLAQAPAPPTADAPVTLARRLLEGEGFWSVTLEGFRDTDAWRGRMVFREGVEGPAHPTAVIFREADPLALRARFRSFDQASLEAFLRSALP